MYAQKIKRKKLSFGAVALATPFPSKGIVSIVGSIAGGSRAWGSEEVADVAAQMLLEGTKTHSKKELQKILDGMGASLSFSAGSERLSFTAKVRPVHTGALLALIVECLTASTFPEPELAVLKMREAANLEFESQNTNAQASSALARMLFKPGHPNYSETTAESVEALKKINARDLRERHAQMLDGRTLVLSMSGDITATKVFALAQSNFKSLPQHAVILKKYAKAAALPAKQKFIPINNKASIDYMTGVASGITSSAGEYPALFLGIAILGRAGGFIGRLMSTVREEEGLTYGIYAYPAGFKKNTDGYLYVWATFAPELYEKGKKSIARQLDLLLSKGVTEEEVKKHRELYYARTRVQLSNSGAFAKVAHDTVVDGQDLSYLDEFPKKILTLKAAQVNKALKKYLILKKLSEAAAGPV